MAVGHILKSKRGVGGGTFGNWQVALAYAKYLSPEFHAWCNTVVRERMEGKLISTTSLPPDVLEMVRRIDGISRMSIHKVTEMEKAVASILSIVVPNEPVLIRRGKTAGQIWARYNFPRLKSASKWFGNRLADMGCMVSRCDRGDSAVRLFDPDRAELVMNNGLLHLTKEYIAQRQGQGWLRLVSPTSEA